MPFKPGAEWNGNRNGPPKKPEIQQLREALERARKENGGVSFLDHYCSLAYKNPDIAKALANKILPDLSKSENTDLVKMVMMPPIKVNDKQVEV
jgi:hypothetical protein